MSVSAVRASLRAVLSARLKSAARSTRSCGRVRSSRDRQSEARYGLDGLRRGHDLGFDPRGGKEQVDDDSADVFSRRREPDGRQASDGVLLDRRDDAPTPPLEIADESLGVTIAGDAHGQVGVARESGLGAGRDREAADQREPTTELPKVCDDATERGFGAAQGRDGGQEMEWPQPSPCSAPGRVSSQATSIASISSSLASGCSRRSCASRIDSPSAQRSKAVRNRAAIASGESSATLSV